MPKRYAGPVFMQRTGRLPFIFLFLFVLATVATAFHHHADGADHHDCPICVAALHHSAASISAFSFGIQQPITVSEASYVPLRYDPIRVALRPPRAPPV
jgi:hypothetical protein